jgi:hypothetical protein
MTERLLSRSGHRTLMANLGAESIKRFARPEWRFLANADTRIDQDECLELVAM